MKKPIKIRLYGESLKIHRIAFKKSHIDKFRNSIKNSKEPIEEALLDLFFYHKLGIKEIQSINDLINYSYGGLMNTPNSQVEIWRGRKKLARLSLEDIIRPKTLFPLIPIETNTLDLSNFDRGILFEEKLKGLIGIYELDFQNFNIDYLKFELLKFRNITYNTELIHNIWYNNKKLKPVKTDCLVSSQRCFKV